MLWRRTKTPQLKMIAASGATILIALGIVIITHIVEPNKRSNENLLIGNSEEPQTKTGVQQNTPKENGESVSQTMPEPTSQTETPTGETSAPLSVIAAAEELTPLVQKYAGKEIAQIPTQQKIIALTFDGGANADGAEKILGILKTHRLRATFFVTGKFAEKYPSLIRKIATEGHEIGNHTYSHPYLTKISAEKTRTEIAKTNDILKNLGVTPAPIFRCPYGDRNESVNQTISAAGYLNLRWTIDSLGWKGTSGGMSAAAVQERILKNAKPGAILMMHLGSNPDDRTQLDSEVLEIVIEKLQAQNYELLSASAALLRN